MPFRMDQNKKLFEQFPPVSTADWMDKINSDLKGADFHKKLVWKTNEGFNVNPFYRMEDVENLPYIDSLPGVFPYLRGIKTKDNNWLVRQNIEVSDYSRANRKALTILMKGIDSVGFIISDPATINDSNFDLLLERIFLGGLELNFSSEGKAIEIIDILIRYVRKSFSDPNQVRGAIEADPLSRLMLNGTLCIPPENGFDYLASVVKSLTPLPNYRAIQINASNLHNAGADIVQELAFALSMGNEYLSQLTERGISSNTVASRIRFSFGIGPDYFPEIAKLRAARLLWSVIVNGFSPGTNEIKMDIHCVTGKLNKTIYDPYVNLLRTQTEAMSAILGGTNSLTVEPFDTVFRQPDEFSERIARNQQLILMEEAYFDKVADPSAGSYYIENLTKLISDSSWKLFLEIEENGGFLSCLKSGFIQKKLAESKSKRESDIATRKTVLLGTNQYPNNLEKISDKTDIRRIFTEKKHEGDLIVEPVQLFRGSEKFDALRMAVDKSEKRPSVFLLQIGNPLMSKVRSQFSSNFFACAGYRNIDKGHFTDAEEAVKSALQSEPEIVVICSSDEEYLSFAPGIFDRLKDKSIIVIAGNPACADDLRSKGVQNFIHVKSNVIETLTEFNMKLGIGF